ncbi:MAG TPA: FHA domain-containing protein, partial [Brevefilum sp.]
MAITEKSFFHTQIITLILVLVSALFCPYPANAQDDVTNGSATISQLNTESFPQISFFLETEDAAGNAIVDLDENAIAIIENGSDPIAPETVERNEPGYQVIMAYNLSPSLATLTADGVSRYQVITDHIINWLNSRPANTPDDFSLATDTGLQQIRRQNPREFAQELSAYEPQLSNSQPNLTSLLQALDLATDLNPNPLMKRVIFYITPQLNLSSISAIPGFIDRAIQQDVAIIVWMVGPATARSSNASVVEPMVELAEKSGGQFYLFSGVEELPDIEGYFGSNRYVYEVTYRSQINTSGFHRIEAVVNDQDQPILSNQESVRLVIQPPTPILINPPLLIDRIWDVDPNDARIRDLTPDEVEINYIYQFTDEYPRELSSARLFIDNQMVQEVNEAPFERFILDLSTIETDQELLFYVEVQDVLGLSAQTEPTIIDITVEPVPLTFWEGLMRLELSSERWIILASILIAGTILIVAIVFVGNKQSFWREQTKLRKQMIDPVTQPVKINQDGGGKKKGAGGNPSAGKQVEAMLVPINDQFEPDRKKTVVLDKREWVIGSDEKLARLVIKNAALDSLHARLARHHSGEYWLRDQNSIAGTWVNFKPISNNGIK